MLTSSSRPSGWKGPADAGEWAFPADAATVHDAFTAQARATPHAVAVVAGARRVTYADLSARTAVFAAGLRAQGVAPGDRVVVWLDRSADLVALLLAVMAVGAAYVPVDGGAPAARVRQVVDDCAAALTVADPQLAAEADLPGPVACLPGLQAAAPSAADAPAQVPGEAPAYVIYTSGSTGRPKGVVVAHRNVLALLRGTAPGFGLGPGQVWSWFHSVAFDFSVWEVWGCLLTGGRLVMAGEEERTSAADFAALLVAEQVTVLSQTPSAFAALTAPLLAAADAMPVRLVVFGGEALDTGTLLPWLDRFPAPGCRLVNMFGITETTVHVTWQLVDRAEAEAGSRSVGHPLPGWSVEVVGPDRFPLPVGESGEIAVGGAGIACGYFAREELTRERFAPCPATGEPRYYSGDLGRLLPDGRLEHLGRLDEQVKLRGFRIELGEIRAALVADPTVAAAAVVLRRPVPGDPAFDRLDAYVVAAGEARPDQAAVRSRLAASLPGYLVPATVTVLATLPLTGNGKLDASRLPLPLFRTPAEERTGQQPAEAQEQPPEPSDAVTGLVLDAWTQVLGGPADEDVNFFDAGGNSLLAARLVACLREQGLPGARVRDVLTAPTPRLLGQQLATRI